MRHQVEQMWVLVSNITAWHIVFIYHILSEENANSTGFEREKLPGSAPTQSCLGIDVNCQHRLTGCQSVSDSQFTLITGAAHKPWMMEQGYESWPCGKEITFCKVKRAPALTISLLAATSDPFHYRRAWLLFLNVNFRLKLSYGLRKMAEKCIHPAIILPAL